MASATVGILRALLSADSAEFVSDMKKAGQASKGLTDDFKTLGVSAERLSAQTAKLAQQFSGGKLFESALATAQAVEKIGGAAALTATEQGRVNSVLTEAIAKYKALGQQAPQAILDLEKATRTLQPANESAFASFSKLVGSFITAEAIIGGVKLAWRALTQFIGSSIESYAAAEAAQSKLTAALRAQSLATPELIKQYDALSQQFQRTTVFSDELIAEMQALLVQVGNVMPRDMEKALTAATNLSAGLGVDLRTATLLVGKAFEGETGTLKRYGIVIDEAKLKTEGITAVLEAVNSKFGGQAQAQLDTYSGRVAALSNAWDDLKEAVGRFAVESPLVEAGIRAITDAITGQNEALKDAPPNLHRWSDGLKSVSGQLIGLNPQLAEGGRLAGEWIRLFEDAAIASNNFARAAKNVPKITEVFGDVDARAFKPSTEGLAIFNTELAKYTEAQKQAKAAAEAHTKAVGAWLDRLTGATAIKDAALATEALKKAQASGLEISNLTREAQAALNRTVTAAIDVYQAAGQAVPSELAKIRLATQQWFDAVHDGGAVMRDFIASLKELRDEGFLPIIEAAERAKLAVLDWGQAAQVATEEARAAMTEVSTLGDEIKGVFANIGSDLSIFIQQAFTGGGGFFSALKGLASKIGSDIGRILGAATGIPFMDQILGAFGSLLGPLIGKIKDWFGGPSQLELDGRRVAADFRRGLEAGLNETQRAEALKSGNAAWAASVIAIRDAYLAVGRTEKEALEASRRLWAAEKEGPEAVRRVIDEINAVLGEHNELLQQTGEEARFNWEAAEQAAARYGVRLGTLGSEFEKARLGDKASALLSDWELLTKGIGVDLGGVLFDMREEVSALVRDFIAAGQAIPAGLRPLVEELIRSGNLLDENGNALTDLGRIRFTDTIDETEDVTDATEEWHTQLGEVDGRIGDIGGTLNETPFEEWARRAQEAANSARDAFRDVFGGGIPLPPIPSPGAPPGSTEAAGLSASFSRGFPLNPSVASSPITLQMPVYINGVLDRDSVRDIFQNQILPMAEDAIALNQGPQGLYTVISRVAASQR